MYWLRCAFKKEINIHPVNNGSFFDILHFQAAKDGKGGNEEDDNDAMDMMEEEDKSLHLKVEK